MSMSDQVMTRAIILPILPTISLPNALWVKLVTQVVLLATTRATSKTRKESIIIWVVVPLTQMWALPTTSILMTQQTALTLLSSPYPRRQITIITVRRIRL
ncbi:hypothetical protein BCR41DRAFT_345252 [Lobosporangium transversale]|uniref:Uncharacterized protein n=1 Tax=Lobosporangium transversale TaxID=64571 RepID=A0A1Y2H1I7_9FUNG|nr:hypothetical protein BCR41DRAFT_345252 [Lobosporangium transversale]ORZ28418.1 hypothetical protein BCR41DRAFT_345252 [Lobosporangium transversale]|eukprot:XP_021886103.1 hypothetical protein BCR41DRAFT_345252 [Lobosporangium transversale]